MRFGVGMQSNNRSPQQDKRKKIHIKTFPLLLEMQPGQSMCNYLVTELFFT